MKKSLVIALALMLVLAFATSSMAAQVLSNGSYLSTTATGMTILGSAYDATTGTTSINSRVYSDTKFKADGITNYPYEIYLPNEQNPGAYRIHSSYSKNTDACASCHSTHTAVGDTLLQWYSVYETCMACHDGTVNTTYNVANGQYITSTGNNFNAMGGAFATTSGSASNHNVTGALDISAAPGGTAVEVETANVGSVGAKARWSVAFGCESCHTPHGAGGNARILHPDPNYAASYAANKVTNGYAIVGGQVQDAAGNPIYLLKGYPYTLTFYNGGSVTTSPTINNTTGASIVTGVADRVYGTPALQVKMNIGNYLSTTTPTAKETVAHVSGMNAYCGACHSDYNTESKTHSSDTESGVYTQAHRHQVGVAPLYNSPTNNLPAAGMLLESGKLECLTCHVAHGVNQDYWAKTVGTTGAGTAYLLNSDLVEIAGSSALKRLPNMGTCEACHQKADANQGYLANSQAATTGLKGTVDGGMPNIYGFDARRADILAADPTDLDWVGSAACEPCHKEYVDGWKATSHKSSNHTGATGCGRCHNPGNSLIATGAFAAGQQDSGITCESCHGAGKQHIASPSSKNIFNPGTASIERQAIECGKCHDMYNNTVADTFGLSATSGSSHTSVAKLTTAAAEVKAGWSVGFRVYNNDPAKFALASQFNVTSNHYGGAWGYADSKHFKGTGTSENPNGIVSCSACHDMHSDEVPGLLKAQYEQVCGACHGSSASLAQAVAMPTNSWNRHQIELVDYAHSFKFGAPKTAAEITSATISPVNLEFAPATTGLADDMTTLQDIAVPSSGATDAQKHARLFAGSTRGGAAGMKLAVFNGATQLFNSYDGTFELEYTPIEDGNAVAGVDYIWEEAVGAVEFQNTPATLGTGKLEGTYTVTWTSNVDPTVTATASFTITSTN